MQNWTKYPWCPVCAQLETVSHALHECRFHQLARDIIDYSLGPYYHDGQSVLCTSIPTKSSFSVPQGIALWASRSAHWGARNATKFHGVPPERDVFLDAWARTILTLTEWQPLAGWAQVFMQFHHIIITVRQSGCLPAHRITLQYVAQDTEKEAKQQRKLLRKEQLAEQVIRTIDSLESEGWLLAYTDGSAEYHARVGWVAGFGCTIPGQWEFSGFLPVDMAQSNNRAELAAIIRLLEHTQGAAGKLAIATDSHYAYDGVTGSAYRWRERGWVNKCGPVANVDLWIQLLSLIDSATMRLRWIKVPSHTVAVIAGNRHADHLAEVGRFSSPLYQVLSVPERPVISLELPFTPTPRRAQAVPRSVDILELATPLNETPVLVPGSHHRTPATPPSIQHTPIHCLFGSPQGSHVSCHSVSSTPPRVSAFAQPSGLSSPSGSTVSWAPTTPTLSPSPDVMWSDIGLQPMSTPEPRHRRVLFHTPSTDVSSPRYLSDIGSHMDSGGSQPQSPMSEDPQ